MQQLDNPNIITLLDFCILQTEVIFVLECVAPGSLASVIANFKKLNLVSIRNYMLHILKGLQKLHSMGIAYRNIKPQNVLVTSTGVCKLSDFGLSKFINAQQGNSSDIINIVGTPLYMAPETANGIVSMKGDVWSVGILFHELLTGHVPYDLPDRNTINSNTFITQLGSGRIHPSYKKKEFSAPAIEFLDACLVRDVNKRASVEDLISLSFFLL